MADARARARGVYGEQANRRRDGWTSGQRLERYMYDHGWTKCRLARESGVSLQTVYRVCGGEGVGTVRTWRLLSSAMGATIDEILGYRGEAPR